MGPQIIIIFLKAKPVGSAFGFLVVLILAYIFWGGEGEKVAKIPSDRPKFLKVYNLAKQEVMNKNVDKAAEIIKPYFNYTDYKVYPNLSLKQNESSFIDALKEYSSLDTSKIVETNILEVNFFKEVLKNKKIQDDEFYTICNEIYYSCGQTKMLNIKNAFRSKIISSLSSDPVKVKSIIKDRELKEVAGDWEADGASKQLDIHLDRMLEKHGLDTNKVKLKIDRKISEKYEGSWDVQVVASTEDGHEFKAHAFVNNYGVQFFKELK